MPEEMTNEEYNEKCWKMFEDSMLQSLSKMPKKDLVRYKGMVEKELVEMNRLLGLEDELTELKEFKRKTIDTINAMCKLTDKLLLSEENFNYITLEDDSSGN